ncbi:phosphatase PAP2 family protein [Thermomonospora echinospora]|uniref:phosphatase PAP2 family protein n=1 Tax=Thermomonospora echinospora TaxID=1992 RepID=UPI0011B00342|nr:phosphatase PAP2 family protein [Thermomonospora echinospora]
MPDGVRSTADLARRVDRRLLLWVVGHSRPVLDRWMPRASRATDHLLGWWAVAAVMTAAGDPAVRSAARRAVAAMLLAEPVCNKAAKRVVDRSRPPRSLRGRRPGRIPDTGGFPSGHTAAAAAFTTAVIATTPRVGVPVGLLGAVVAYSRLYTGAHYPSDVAAGALAGATTALALHWSVTRGWPDRILRPHVRGAHV